MIFTGGGVFSIHEGVHELDHSESIRSPHVRWQFIEPDITD